MIKIGIIGYGIIGSQHAKAFFDERLQHASVVAICNRGETGKEKAKADLGNDIALFSDYKDLIDNGNVDAVIIATPHYSHVEIATYALKKKKHVLLEKPAGASAFQVQGLNKTAEANADLVFAMMFNLRENPLYVKAKALITKGKIGAIRRVNWIDTWLYRPQSYFNNGAWRGTWDGEGGGVLLNQASHQLDLLQWLTDMPTAVYAKCRFGAYHDIKVEDDVTAVLTYANGATGVFVASTHEWPGTNRLEIAGDKGRLVVETTLNQEDTGVPIIQKVIFDEYETEEQAFSTATANDAKWNEYAFKRSVFDLSEIMNDKNLAKENRFRVLVNFVACIKDGAQPTAKGVDAINSLTLSNAMLMSAWNNQEIDLKNFDYQGFDEILTRKRENDNDGA